jgi:hypothetical protein
MAFEASFLGGWSWRKLMRSLKFIALLKKGCAKFQLNQQEILVSDYLVDDIR